MSKGHLEAVIWDLDGVIADTVEYHYQAWRDVFKERGVDYRKTDFMPYFGRRHDTIIKAALGDKLLPEELDAINEEKQRNFRRRVEENIVPMPGAIALIKSLHEHRIKSAIASSAVPENIEIILRGLGIADCFWAVVHGMEVKEGKPSPQIFLLAAKKLKLKPSNCVVIEDAIAGVAAARRAGMKCIAVTNSHTKEALKDADLIVDSLGEIGVSDLARLFKNS
jgi:beta-phosphoglucomutase family hydrolase